MKRFPGKLFAVIMMFICAGRIYADSKRAYDDYLYQYDVYRAKLSEFQIARGEYLKFNTLTSQSDALQKSNAMMAQRDQLLRAYLLLLNERINENSGISPSNKTVFQTLINNEITFLEAHSKLVSSVSTIPDATQASKKLENHYRVLQSSMIQTIAGISLGELVVLARTFDTVYGDLNAVIAQYGRNLPASKQSIIDRWMIQIADKRSLFQQKLNEIVSSGSNIKLDSDKAVENEVRKTQRLVSEAKSYINDATANMYEVMRILKYGN